MDKGKPYASSAPPPHTHTQVENIATPLPLVKQEQAIGSKILLSRNQYL